MATNPSSDPQVILQQSVQPMKNTVGLSGEGWGWTAWAAFQNFLKLASEARTYSFAGCVPSSQDTGSTHTH
jgi:hypothetical protein